MEFLSPKEKRARTIKLFTGYALIAVLIGLATLVLVYLAQGYGYDPQKGVSRSGLVFFAAKPGTADIYVDGQKKDKTDARLTLDEGIHQTALKKDKYRDWTKTINVEGGSVLYLSYVRLFPVNIPLGITQAFTNAPAWTSQSLDRRWLVLQPKTDTPTLQIYDLLKPTTDPKTVTLPVAQVSSEAGNFGALAPVEWSDDNKHLLLKQTLPSGKITYVVFDREDNAQTFNATKKLSLPDGYALSLRNKNFDRYYAFNQGTGEIRTADAKSGMQTVASVTGVVSFKSYADDLILYTTYNNAAANQVNVFVQSGNSDTYRLQALPKDANNRYLLDMAKYDNSWYYITASSSDKKALMYKDPLSKIKPGNITPAAPRLALVINNPQFASFSDNTRFIGLQSGKQFVVFDAELNRVYRYQSALAIADTQQAKWMDGHRFSVVADGKESVFDFDGTNVQTLVNSRQEFPAYFDRDYQYVYTLVPQADGKTGMQNGQIILP
ncbi:MAG: PEGA domain-containing protein [Candidatus Saccharimonadales bacterium]